MTTEGRKIKVLLAKSDMDAHERGMRYIAQVLREAGMEVIFIRYRIIDEVVPVALQEDVDAIGLSSYGPGLLYEMSKVQEMLRERKVEDILLLAGGHSSEPDGPSASGHGCAWGVQRRDPGGKGGGFHPY